MRAATFALLTALLLSASARAAAQTTAPGGAPATDETSWSFSVSAYAYLVPDSANYVQPTVAADRRWPHLEARFNYEDRDTGSAWFGYNFSAGERVTFEITPMVGAVFGNTAGVAPGYSAALGWRKLELSSESEYVLDASDSDASFLYAWSELTLAPTDRWRFGLAVQRTKVYRTEFDIQRGFVVGLSIRRAEFSCYVFNPDASPTVVLAARLAF